MLRSDVVLQEEPPLHWPKKPMFPPADCFAETAKSGRESKRIAAIEPPTLSHAARHEIWYYHLKLLSTDRPALIRRRYPASEHSLLRLLPLWNEHRRAYGCGVYVKFATHHSGHPDFLSRGELTREEKAAEVLAS